MPRGCDGPASHLTWPLHGHPGVCDQCSAALPAPSWASPSGGGGSRASPDRKAGRRPPRGLAPGRSPGLAPSLSATSPGGPGSSPQTAGGLGPHSPSHTVSTLRLCAQLRPKRLPLGAAGTVLPGPGLGAEGCWAVAGHSAPGQLNPRVRGGCRDCEAVSHNPSLSLPPEGHGVCLHPSQNSPLHCERKGAGR